MWRLPEGLSTGSCARLTMNWDGERVFVGVGETKPMAKVMRSPGGWRDQTKPKPKDDAAKGFQTWQQATSDGLQKGLNGFKMVFL